MGFGYIHDHADRTWAVKLESREWWQALWGEVKHVRDMHGEGLFPRVAISSQCPRVVEMFQRRVRE